MKTVCIFFISKIILGSVMSRLIILLAFIIILPSSEAPLRAQGFGQNKVQYKDFEWKFIRSKHFDIFFYQGGQEIAEFAAVEIERSYVRISKAFKWKLSRRGLLILYNSHNDFQQTNTVQTYLPEGVGGVTELFKNRVILPFEGDYAQFRHVLAHELVHAVMNDMLYGGSVQALIANRAVQVPIWFSEGLAEFLSVGWTNDIDMLVRDVLVNSTLEKEVVLNGLPYHFGTSMFRYINEQYGFEKISEILHKVRGAVSFRAALEQAVGIPIEDLYDDWYTSLKREYWPDIENRTEPKDVARQITGKSKDEKREVFSTFVYGPSIAPSGDKIAYIYRRNLDNGIFIESLISETRTQIAEGESASHFEELHILHPGLSFSPDGRYLAFSAKGGDADVIHIYDTFEETLETLRFSLDGLFGASWSPNGRFIAFRGIYNGFADIYIYDLQQKLLQQLTYDKFDDIQPTWSFDSRKLYFASDRDTILLAKTIGAAGYNMSAIEKFNWDLYVYDFDAGEMRQLTNTEHNEIQPYLADGGRRLLYISDENGVQNSYVRDLRNDDTYALTNFFDGVHSFSWSERSQQLLFVSFSRMNRNAFLLRDPLKIKPQDITAVRNLDKRGFTAVSRGALEKVDEEAELTRQQGIGNYRNYVFGRDQMLADDNAEELRDDMFLPGEVLTDSSGNYIVNNYKLKFSADLINGIVGYDTYYGVQGYTQMLFSDVLGDHQIMAGTNLVFDLRNSDVIFQYRYLPNRIDFGLTVYHLSDLFLRTGFEDFRPVDYLIRFRSLNVGIDAYYPISKYSRIQAGVHWRQVSEENLTSDREFGGDVHTTMMRLAYVQDDTQWWYFAGPVRGLRFNLSFTASPMVKEDSKEFFTFKYDFRKYFHLGLGYSLATRFSGGLSTGASPQRFFLGGISNWINPTFRGGVRVNSDDIYFSEFVTPLRGGAYYELVGSNYAISNIELRFPFVFFLGIGFLPIQLNGIEGVAFADIGTAWDNINRWQLTTTTEDGRVIFDDLFTGYGTGVRAAFFGFLWRFDIAWKYDYNGWSDPRYYWSFGLDF
jgi:Tol biopolymer transport system component